MTEADGNLSATPVVTALRLYPNLASRPLPRESCFDTTGTPCLGAGAGEADVVAAPLARRGPKP